MYWRKSRTFSAFMMLLAIMSVLILPKSTAAASTTTSFSTIETDVASKPQSAPATQANCDPERDLTGWFVRDDKTAVKNTSATCSYDVGMASYRKFDNDIDNQEIFDWTERVIGPQQTINLEVDLPGCATQIDVFYGQVLMSLNGKRYGTRLLSARHINGSNWCTPLPEAPCEAGSITGFSGVSDGDIVSGILYIEALVSGTTPQKVVFELSGPVSLTHTENNAPYRFIGGSNGWNTDDYPEGEYTLTATYYGLHGESIVVPCNSISISFTIDRTPEPTATATPVNISLTPILECVVDNGNGSYTAFFGYNNPSDSVVNVAVGNRNKFTPTPQNRGQPTSFEPGRTPYWPDAAFSVDFNGEPLVWTLTGKTATASRNGTPCSFHVFFDKVWVDANGDSRSAPPASIAPDYKIVAQSELGTAECVYPAGSDTLTCTYNNQRPPALDNKGLWVPVGSTYTVEEFNLPPGWTPASGVGSFIGGDDYCEYGYNGAQKYCLHTVVNEEEQVTPTLEPTLEPTAEPTNTPTPVIGHCPPGAIDFDTDANGNPIAAGTWIGEQWSAWGVHISGFGRQGYPDQVIAFDSANPTGGDWDLGTPNEDFGGPGRGVGGEAGQPGANMTAQGNVLILAQDLVGGNPVSNPNDSFAGGELVFTFDQPYQVASVKMLDVDGDEDDNYVDVFDVDGDLIKRVFFPPLGDNSFQEVAIDATNVGSLRFFLKGSGAISTLIFCDDDEPRSHQRRTQPHIQRTRFFLKGSGAISTLIFCDDDEPTVTPTIPNPISNEHANEHTNEHANEHTNEHANEHANEHTNEHANEHTNEHTNTSDWSLSSWRYRFRYRCKW